MADKLIISGEKTKNAIVVSQQKTDNKINISGENGSNSLTAINNNAKYYTDKAEGFANKAEQSAIKSANSATQAQESVNTILNNENFISVSENLEVINTVAESIENVNYVGENIEEINKLVDDLESLGDTTNIEIVASNIDSVNTTAENIEAVKTLSGSTNNMATIVNNLTSINYVADNIEDVATVEENKNIVLAQTIIATEQATIASNSASQASIYSQEAKAFRDEAEEIVTNAGSNASWGNISGTLSNQLDLQTVLDKKLENQSSFNNALSIGEGNTDGGLATIIGFGNTSDGFNSILIGNNNYQNAINNICIGEWCEATGNNSICIGNSAVTALENSIQLGGGFNTTPNSFQVGEHQLLNIETGKIPAERLPDDIGGSVDLTGYIKNKQDISGAISIGNTTSAYDSTTVGSGARSGKYGAAFGRLTLASGEYSVAMGNGAEASGDGSTAMGSGSSAVTQATAIGKSAKAKAAHSIQIGQGTNSTVNTLQAGNYPLLDLSTGKIPEERLPEPKGGLPVGTVLPVTASYSHVPENTLYCDGTEFSGAEGQMFRNLYVDYLVGVAKIINAQIIIPTSEGFEGIFKFKTSSDITTNQQLISNDDLGYVLAYISSGKLYYTETINGDLVELGTLTANSSFYLKIRVSNSTQTIAFGTSLANVGTAKTFASGDVGSNITITTHNTATSVYANSTINGNALYYNSAFNSKVEAYSVTITDIEGALEGARLDTCSYAEYENDLTIYGQCIKWAVDTANEKFRIPLIKDGSVVQQAGVNSIGKSFNAGLPNIEGETIGFGVKAYGDSAGAFYGKEKKITTSSYTQSATSTTLSFDASLSNPIYGNSDTVQMNAVAVRHFVVVSTGSINQSEADWSEFASSLASKANTDLSNCTRPYVIETSDKSLLPSWYRVWSDGWCEQGGWQSVAGGNSGYIALLKEYKNFNYTVTSGQGKPNATTPYSAYANCVSAYSTTQLYWSSYDKNEQRNFYWETKGYIN